MTNEQIKDIFENCRNLGICGAIFASSDWEIAHINDLHSTLSIVNVFVLIILLLVGSSLFFLAQQQAFHRLNEFGFVGIKLTIFRLIYSFVTTLLMASIFLH